MNEDRIKLALAMGWTLGDLGGIWPPKGHESYGTCMQLAVVPDPFTDANDDYAVLEWMRSGNVKAQQIIDGLEAGTSNNFCDTYRIGDFARAALKVIE